MNCDRFKKYFEKNENVIQSNLPKDIIQHANNCANCSKIIEEQTRLKKEISELQKLEPELEFPHELTNSILNSINEVETKEIAYLKVGIKSFYSIKIAASVLIILCSLGTFITQYVSIQNKSEALQLCYEIKLQNSKLLQDYTECLNDSENLLTELVKSDIDLVLSYADQSVFSITAHIDRYAANLCRVTQEYYAETNSEKRKHILMNYIKSEFSVN